MLKLGQNCVHFFQCYIYANLFKPKSIHKNDNCRLLDEVKKCINIDRKFVQISV